MTNVRRNNQFSSSNLMATDLKGVVPGRNLLGPDRADPDNGAENAGVRTRQDPVLDGDLLEQLELVECIVRIKILKHDVANYEQGSRSRS